MLHSCTCFVLQTSKLRRSLALPAPPSRPYRLPGGQEDLLAVQFLTAQTPSTRSSGTYPTTSQSRCGQMSGWGGWRCVDPWNSFILQCRQIQTFTQSSSYYTDEADLSLSLSIPISEASALRPRRAAGVHRAGQQGASGGWGRKRDRGFRGMEGIGAVIAALLP